MKNIKLLRLYMENFKGFKEQEVQFGDTTTIYGRNASGKTSIMDAFLYLLFGKDSQGRSDFQRRPLDENGQMVNNVEILVEGTLAVDDGQVTFKKVERQVWTKHRGDKTESFTGNVTDYYIDGFPSNKKEYEQRISEIVGEDLFRLLTSPKYFASLKWQEQRNILLKMVLDITDEELLSLHPEFELIREDILTAGQEKCREKYTVALKKLKELEKQYPVRIDEASRTIVEVDVDALTAQKADLEAQLAAIEAEKAGLVDVSTKARTIQAQIMEAKLDAESLKQTKTAEVRKIRSDKQAEVSEIQGEIDSLNRRLIVAKRALADAQDIIADAEEDIEAATADYKTVKARTLPEDAVVCPTCGRIFEADKVNEIRTKFEQNKAASLESILARGRRANKVLEQNRPTIEPMTREIASLTEQLTTANEKLTVLQSEYNSLPSIPDMTGDAKFIGYLQKIGELEAQLDEVNKSGFDSTISERTRTVTEALNKVNADLSMVDSNKRARERIKALTEEQRDNAQAVADQEQLVYLLEEFVKVKMNTLSDHINAKFKSVRFKLFDTQINGAVKECCTMQINSNGSYVDYANANSAAQITGGLDVIDALTELYQISAPVWTDNAECLDTNNQPKTRSQLIMLKVSDDKELKIIKEER